MRINTKALAYTLAIVWGASVLFVGLLNYFVPPYGQAFRDMVASIYPGYQATPGLWGVLIGTAYAMADGLVGGVIIGAIYNAFAGKPSGATNFTDFHEKEKKVS